MLGCCKERVEVRTTGAGALAGMIFGAMLGLPFGPLGVLLGGLLGAIVGDQVEYQRLLKRFCGGRCRC